MIKRIAQVVNSLLKHFGVRIVRANIDLYDATFDMSSAIKRLAALNMPIRSIIDIGASDGKWSVNTMKIFKKSAFLAIEPLCERQDALEALKRSHDNFDYRLCVAGGNDREQVTLNVSDDLDGSAVDGKDGKPRSVSSMTIDTIVKERGLEGPYLLKFDTHGFEVPILAGAKETLAKTSAIVMEVYNFKITEHALRFHEMCSHMEQFGFRCYDIASPLLRPRDNAFWQMDILFARSDSGIFSCDEYR